jgi:hypothetical protein
MGDRGSVSGSGRDLYLIAIASRPAVGPTHPVQWVTGGLSLGKAHLYLVPKLRMRGDIPPFHHMSSWLGT